MNLIPKVAKNAKFIFTEFPNPPVPATRMEFVKAMPYITCECHECCGEGSGEGDDNPTGEYRIKCTVGLVQIIYLRKSIKGTALAKGVYGHEIQHVQIGINIAHTIAALLKPYEDEGCQDFYDCEKNRSHAINGVGAIFQQLLNLDADHNYPGSPGDGVQIPVEIPGEGLPDVVIPQLPEGLRPF